MIDTLLLLALLYLAVGFAWIGVCIACGFMWFTPNPRVRSLWWPPLLMYAIAAVAWPWVLRRIWLEGRGFGL